MSLLYCAQACLRLLQRLLFVDATALSARFVNARSIEFCYGLNLAASMRSQLTHDALPSAMAEPRSQVARSLLHVINIFQVINRSIRSSENEREFLLEAATYWRRCSAIAKTSD